MSFETALSFTLSQEGYYSNNPADPGGATYRGITQRVYDRYRDGQGLHHQDVRKITDDELQTIYRQNYWNACSGDELGEPVDLAVFDAAVNCGPGRSARWLQKAVGVTADGVIGPGTVAAVGASNLTATALAHVGLRREYYEELDGPFLQGWLNRCDALQAAIGTPDPGD